jgi:MFS family permease
MEKDKLFSKNFFVVFIIDFLLALVYFTLMVTVAQYAVDEFKASTSQAGLVTGIFVLGIMLSRIIVGRIIDNVGRKKILLIGIIFYIAATFMYFIVGNLMFLLIIRFFHGISLGFTSTATATVIVQILPESRRGEGIGIFSLALIISNALGPFLGLFLIEKTSYNSMFICCMIFGLMSLLLTLFLSVPPINQSNENNTKVRRGKLTNFIEPSVLSISIIMLLIGFAYSTIPAFISFFAQDMDLMDEASYFFIVYSVIIILSRPLMGRLFDSKGANMTIYPSLLFFIGGMILLSQVNAGWTLLLAGAFIGFGYGNLVSSGQTLAVKLTPSHRLGMATSTFFVFLNLGFGLGPYLGGLLIPLIGFRGLFMTLAGVSFLCVILYYFMHGRREISQVLETTISIEKN